MSKLYNIYLLIVTFIWLTNFNCKSQNLIANGSFEITTNYNCQGTIFDYQSPIPVFGTNLLNDWDQYQSVDYFNSVCLNCGYSVPCNFFGYSNAKDGNAYCGFAAFGMPGYREYLAQHLAAPLQAGELYCLSFFVSRADRNQYAIKNLGAYFGATKPVMTTWANIPVTPQIVNQTGFISDTIQWTEIQGCFTAVGGEQYIIIGNFNPNSTTDTLLVGTNNVDPNYTGFSNYYSYYYIDDITLLNQTNVGMIKNHNDNRLEIYPNPNTGLLKFRNLQYSYGDYCVKILDLFGREIINELLKDELDISSLDRGVYTLLLYKHKQLVVTKKVMKD